MKMKNSLIISSLISLKKNRKIDLTHFDLFLFGSCLYNNVPNDVDILLLYDKFKISYEEVILTKSQIIKLLSEQLKISIDITLLSKQSRNKNSF